MILPPGRHEPPRCWPIPVRALEGATSYWAGIVANASGHMSHHGAHGTEWTLVAPDELARLASLHPVATRRLPRVQVWGWKRTVKSTPCTGRSKPLAAQRA